MISSQFFRHDDYRKGQVYGMDRWRALMSYKTGRKETKDSLDNFMDLADPNTEGLVDVFHYVAYRLDLAYKQ